jgi:hypothetical protein
VDRRRKLNILYCSPLGLCRRTFCVLHRGVVFILKVHLVTSKLQTTLCTSGIFLPFYGNLFYSLILLSVLKVSDWSIDYHTPGGVDKEGWQYAIDFPATYHGQKHFTDYVRRRRWVRKAQLSTSGPWQELGNTKLVDISLQV